MLPIFSCACGPFAYHLRRNKHLFKSVASFFFLIKLFDLVVEV